MQNNENILSNDNDSKIVKVGNFKGVKWDDEIHFTGSFKDGDDNEVTKGTLKLYADNVELGTCDLDSYGNFLYVWKLDKDITGKSINICGDYIDESGEYLSTKSIINQTMIFNKTLDTQVFTNIKRNSDGSYHIDGYVLDENGVPVVGGNVKVTIAEEEYIVPLDSEGTFSFDITHKNSKKNYEIMLFDWGSKADITCNSALMKNIVHTDLADEIINLCKEGTPVIKFGNGNGPTVVVNAGVHGCELSSQAAVFKLINTLVNCEINGTIYVIPVLIPESTANNSRSYNGLDPNRQANVTGSITNKLIEFCIAVNADALGDFHCTRHGDSDVGATIIMCSKTPEYDSYILGKYISDYTGYPLDVSEIAGGATGKYRGAVEDCANIYGIPAITSETCCNHKSIEYGAPEVSYNMILGFLKFFNFDIKNTFAIPLPSNEGIYDMNIEFLKSYNYNPSNVTLKDAIVVKGNSTPSDLDNKTHYNVSNLPNAGNPLLVLLLTLFALPIIRFKR